MTNATSVLIIEYSSINTGWRDSFSSSLRDGVSSGTWRLSCRRFLSVFQVLCVPAEEFPTGAVQDSDFRELPAAEAYQPQKPTPCCRQVVQILQEFSGWILSWQLFNCRRERSEKRAGNAFQPGLRWTQRLPDRAAA